MVESSPCLEEGVFWQRCSRVSAHPSCLSESALIRERIRVEAAWVLHLASLHDPPLAAARDRGIDIAGPFPGDTVFLRASRGEFDAVIACYHDQGLIPVKLLAFGRSVNVTIGLPIIRTSVDHGTAFDIAGRGVADPSSMVEAVRLAARLVGLRHSRGTV